MASIHRQKGRSSWYCAYTDQNGARHFKSTRTSDKREARRICNLMQGAVDRMKSTKLTPATARKFLERNLEELLIASGTQSMSSNPRDFFEEWVKEKEVTTSVNTLVRYQAIVRNFLIHLGPLAGKPLADISSREIERFRNHIAKSQSPSSANLNLKVIRSAFKKAVTQGLIPENPASNVETIKKSSAQTRRPFQLPELKKLLEVANCDWQTMILVGLYTGLRLSDCASLCWNQVDLQAGEITVETKKTSRTQVLPMATPLMNHVANLPSNDDPRSPLAPSCFDLPSNALSNQFYELMTTAGLVKKRTHQKSKNGLSGSRQASGLGFHCLRHTATSLLKNAGVSDVVARDIIGHESAAISRVYTHIDSETKRQAVNKMPTVL
jgi:integrase